MATTDTTELNTLREQLIEEAPRPLGQIMDEEEMLDKSTFPIKPDKLIEMAKTAIVAEGGLGQNPQLIDTENFVFKAPVIGPLNYKQFSNALKAFNLDEAFPVSFPCLHNFWVDPFEPSRVWYTLRYYSKNTGPILGKPATNLTVDLTPCMHSLVFNEEGKIIKVTIGYAMDRDLGNTGGVGGIFGMLYAIGRPLPFPECYPYKWSLQRKIFQLFIDVTKFFGGLFKKSE